MGEYVCTEEEIYSKLEDALNGLEGGVLVENYKSASELLLNKYKYFSNK